MWSDNMGVFIATFNVNNIMIVLIIWTKYQEKCCLGRETKKDSYQLTTLNLQNFVYKTQQRGNTKSTHTWIWIIFFILNT